MKKLPLLTITALSLGLYSCDTATNNEADEKQATEETATEEGTEGTELEAPTHILFADSLTEGVTKYTGYVSSAEEAEAWLKANPDADKKLVGFIKSADLEKQAVFVYEYEHAGSGMDQPASKASYKEGVLTIEIFDANTSPIRTNDLRRTTYFVAAVLDKDEVNKVVVKNVMVNRDKEEKFPLD